MVRIKSTTRVLSSFCRHVSFISLTCRLLSLVNADVDVEQSPRPGGLGATIIRSSLETIDNNNTVLKTRSVSQFDTRLHDASSADWDLRAYWIIGVENWAVDAPWSIRRWVKMGSNYLEIFVLCVCGYYVWVKCIGKKFDLCIYSLDAIFTRNMLYFYQNDLSLPF